ncbi:hypothetical protein D3C80_1480480 [compost metagenome]
MVVDHQHVQAWIGYVDRFDHRPLDSVGADNLQRHFQANLGADIFEALDGQRASHHFAQAPADREAKASACAGTLAVRVGLDEWVEQALQVIGVNTDAAVTYFQL